MTPSRDTTHHHAPHQRVRHSTHGGAGAVVLRVVPLFLMEVPFSSVCLCVPLCASVSTQENTPSPRGTKEQRGGHGESRGSQCQGAQEQWAARQQGALSSPRRAREGCSFGTV